MPVWGLLIAIADERVFSLPQLAMIAEQAQKPKQQSWLVLAVIEWPQIQQHSRAVPNPSSTIYLFSPH